MKAKRKSNHSDIARSLLELERLFGKKPSPTNDYAHGKVGAGDTGEPIRGGAK
ncbi:MAG: hypothetical protein WAW75_04415 [Gallionella sp.]